MWDKSLSCCSVTEDGRKFYGIDFQILVVETNKFFETILNKLKFPNMPCCFPKSDTSNGRHDIYQNDTVE